MTRRRALVLCPGRGSYSRSQLGTLAGVTSPTLDVLDAARAAAGHPTVREIDGAERYSRKLHVAGEHASILTAGISLADLDQVDAHAFDVVGVCGNSMGWYTALVAAGALTPEAGARLVETMAWYQADNVIGGQVVYPMVDEEWRLDPGLVAAVEDAVASTPDLHWSIRLGGQAVLGGTTEALAAAKARLPNFERGGIPFPLPLPLHSAFHTPLLAATRARAEVELADLPLSAPRVPLIDGRGQIWPAAWADAAAMKAWTLGDQVSVAYDFTAMVTSALGALAPDVIILPGPGTNLGGAIAQVMILQGWQGIRSKSDFLARQKADPIVLAMGRPDQRARVVGA